jgi:hypothetical protein
MLDNPAGQWGELEVPFTYCDSDFSPNNPPRGPNGVLQKYYASTAAWFASGFGYDSKVRGHTQIIVKRGAERQTPPGYSGSGNVSVQLLPDYRYWRFGGSGSIEEHTGRISCNPDEAVQIVGTGAASYA